MAKIFISHSSKDKPFARQLASDLQQLGHIPWLDEWEIKVGECIVTKVEDGLSGADYVIIVLSPNSAQSHWFEREWRAKYWDEVNSDSVLILPALLQDCEIPTLLKTKKYADFRGSYSVGLVQLMGSISPVLNPSEKPLPTLDHSAEVSKLLAQTQSLTVPLSQCIAEALTVAKKMHKPSLEKFCRGELAGWGFDRGNPVQEGELSYRSAEVFVSPYQVNTQYFGWAGNASNILRYIRSDSQNFIPQRWLIQESVSELEARKQTDADKNILSFTMKMSDLMPESPTPNDVVYCYGKADIYEEVLTAVRTELTKGLLDLLPTLEAPIT